MTPALPTDGQEATLRPSNMLCRKELRSVALLANGSRIWPEGAESEGSGVRSQGLRAQFVRGQFVRPICCALCRKNTACQNVRAWACSIHRFEMIPSGSNGS